MKILLVGPNIYEKNKLGGIITVVNQIASKRSDIEYFSRSPERTSPFLDYFKLLLIFISFYRLLKNKFGLIHINTALENTALFRDLILCRIAKHQNQKILLHIHGGRYFSFTPSNRKEKLIQSMLQYADKVIVLSKNEKELLSHHYVCPPIEVLENAIEIPEVFINNPIPKNFQKLNFIYLGRVAPNKGLEDVLKGLKILKDKNISFIYKVYGNGPFLKEYLKDCEQTLNRLFVYGGVVFGNEKWEAYNESNIFLLPSLFEGLPMSLLEAMAAGNICITTKVGSIPRVIKDYENGIFVSKQSPEDIAKCAIDILNNPAQATKISKNAINTISRDFNLSNYLDKLTLIYNSLSS